MTSKGRYKANECKEFEEVTIQGGVKRQRCQHCADTVSSKVERLRGHLKKCTEYHAKCEESALKDHDTSEHLQGQGAVSVQCGRK